MRAEEGSDSEMKHCGGPPEFPAVGGWWLPAAGRVPNISAPRAFGVVSWVAGNCRHLIAGQCQQKDDLSVSWDPLDL